MATVQDRERARALLDFWFGAPGTPDHDRPREVWFAVTSAFDEALREHFLADQERAAAGAYDGWTEERGLCLALVLLLDQLPRNLYRGSPQAYLSDGKARAVAREALSRGFDRTLPPVRRLFLYLPFEHSEDPRVQDRSLELFGDLAATCAPHEKDEADEQLVYAERHADIIARFGRFPHRNDCLGRRCTEEELAFLAGPNASL